jgi:hypothetical protein
MSRDIVRLPEKTESALNEYRENGYLLLPGLLSPEDTETVRTDVMGIMDTIGLGQTALKQTSEYLAGGGIDALVNSPNLQQIASWLMEGEARIYLPFTAVKSSGGGGAFHYHQDNQYTRFDGPGINLWVALVPMNEENGCLYMVPHSHFLGTLPSVKDAAGKVHDSGIVPTRSIPIPMQPGDCVAFSRITVHGSGQNTSGAHRTAYAVQYAREDVRYTRDHSATWQSIREDGPGWRTGPVETITIPKGKVDGH